METMKGSDPRDLSLVTEIKDPSVVAIVIAEIEEDLKIEQDSESRKEMELLIGDASAWLQHLKELIPRTNRETNCTTKPKKRKGRLGGGG